MKYIKTFEDINKIDKRKGVFVGFDDIIYVVDFLKERNIEFVLFFGSDDDDDDDLFLILINNGDYKKLDYNSAFKGFDSGQYSKDYYLKINGEKVYLNWFEPENIEGEWQIIRNTDNETIEAIVNSKKYNI